MIVMIMMCYYDERFVRIRRIDRANTDIRRLPCMLLRVRESEGGGGGGGGIVCGGSWSTGSRSSNESGLMQCRWKENEPITFCFQRSKILANFMQNIAH